MGNGNHFDDHEWAAEKTDRVAKLTKQPTLNTHHTQQADSNSSLVIGVPHKRAETNCAARAYMPRNMHGWAPFNPGVPFRVGSGSVPARHPRAIPSNQAACAVRGTAGRMDASLLHGSLGSGAPRTGAIRLVGRESAFHLQHFPHVTTAPSPQVCLLSYSVH